MPKVVAVIGASSNRRKFGNRAVRAFVSQGYTVVPINPHETEIEGLRTFASVIDVPGAIDTAVFEKAAGLATVVTDPGWSDVGTWAAVYELAAAEGLAVALPEGVAGEDAVRVHRPVAG